MKLLIKLLNGSKYYHNTDFPEFFFEARVAKMMPKQLDTIEMKVDDEDIIEVNATGDFNLTQVNGPKYEARGVIIADGKRITYPGAIITVINTEGVFNSTPLAAKVVEDTPSEEEAEQVEDTPGEEAAEAIEETPSEEEEQVEEAEEFNEVGETPSEEESDYSEEEEATDAEDEAGELVEVADEETPIEERESVTVKGPQLPEEVEELVIEETPIKEEPVVEEPAVDLSKAYDETSGMTGLDRLKKLSGLVPKRETKSVKPATIFPDYKNIFGRRTAINKRRFALNSTILKEPEQPAVSHPIFEEPKPTEPTEPVENVEAPKQDVNTEALDTIGDAKDADLDGFDKGISAVLDTIDPFLLGQLDTYIQAFDVDRFKKEGASYCLDHPDKFTNYGEWYATDYINPTPCRIFFNIETSKVYALAYGNYSG